MTKKPCDVWRELLYGKIPYARAPYTAPFYDEFIRDRKELVDHLDNCNRCRSRVLSLSSGTSPASLKQLSDDDLRQAIGQLRDSAIKRWQGHQKP